uniref:Uncharacterized protein n=1 Tax=Utricularia reniformis TaxID=192314 RepID=A0A1Y0B0N0_9LAMI|nr:hypothetical protein AEK19_MT0759 [Utricularia reniformis]ART31002.1 hypothetical protein AEK19_MT0759 [Utricularia reniformis]
MGKESKKEERVGASVYQTQQVEGQDFVPSFTLQVNICWKRYALPYLFSEEGHWQVTFFSVATHR